ncbi:uncharacterized protein LACBIDRAFT_299182 [Laccaria bicolor S238N-H82]|uniref:Predicted protein n=1 Tax=Laccaria bicolor (strain S238N-H82 / ATCC MYA-4686) TaxID=486041 RepID=B0E3M2_LACBS|nr:uncharacterized protein LACBIDRAFT_299182 [Laccaria bicolor S238N-H82]EDQ98559.1 predicted protein [Laccaria bicolor S238N-H82]|eukprot:XP_001890794.1 predicted protein [Laccaria bicolor S238N-H82]
MWQMTMDRSDRRILGGCQQKSSWLDSTVRWGHDLKHTTGCSETWHLFHSACLHALYMGPCCVSQIDLVCPT